MPEQAFRNEMTTGMSAPPMGTTLAMPSTSPATMSNQKMTGLPPAATHTPRATARAASAASPYLWPG